MLDLSWITEHIAIGGRIPCERIDELARAHQVAAVIDLRDEACDDASQLSAHGIAFLHLPTPDLCAVTAASLRSGVAFARAHLAERRRVLVHCEHGIGRSATLVLCVLVAEGHAPLAALELAKARREKVSPSPAQYEAWAAWLREVGGEPPAFDAFAAIAYRHLRSAR